MKRFTRRTAAFSGLLCAAYVAAVELKPAPPQINPMTTAAPTTAAAPTTSLPAISSLATSSPVAGLPATSSPASNLPTTDGDVVALEIFPPSILLDSKLDAQQIVVRALDAGGAARDVTASATLSLVDPARAELSGDVLRPLSDGPTQLHALFAGRTAAAAVEVRQSAVVPKPSFRRDVLPILTKVGCNKGSCHGAARGKDGFRLSLLGYDPDLDYYRLTREHPGRRLNLREPDDSLLLLKASGRVPHTGGGLIPRTSPFYRTLRRWISEGAAGDEQLLAAAPPQTAAESAADRARRAGLEPVNVEIFPRELLLTGDKLSQQFIIRARYADGTDRDITSLARFKSTDGDVVAVDEIGRVTSGRRGEAFISAAFGDYLVGAVVTVVPGGSTVRPGPAENPLDRAIEAKLAKLDVDPVGPCDDPTFLRRLSFDLLGRPPRRDEFERFRADKSVNRRERLVDELLGRPEFVDLWTMYWSDLLQMRSVPTMTVSFKGTDRYAAWIRDQVERNTPIDAIVRQLLTAQGSAYAQPAAHFFMYEPDPQNLAENVAQSMLGVRLKCAKCHNHPFDRWTMDDYFGFAAFFARIDRKKGFDPRDKIIAVAEEGEVENPLRKRPATPKFLGGATPEIGPRDRRAVLADWLASADNPWFARHWANLIWSKFFGVGVIEPFDDARFSNPPSNAELLDVLASRLVAHRFDLRKLVREICLSRAYQRSSVPTDDGLTARRYFGVWPVRRLRAEVLLDAVTAATEAELELPQQAAGNRAVQLTDGYLTNYFLATFGRASHRTVCSCEVKSEPTLSQSLHLINGDTVHENIRSGGLIDRLLVAGRMPDEIVEELYVRCLGRLPSALELAAVREQLVDDDDLTAVLEDVFWALLNSRESVFLH
jgi:hypothetical protein